MKGITCILLIFFGTICMKANSQNENTMVELRDTIEINTTIAAVANWFENLDTNFVRWNKRHTEFRYLTGGKEIGDRVYFAQCVEGVWYKIKAAIVKKEINDELFLLTVKSTTGLGIITFRADKLSDSTVRFIHIECFGKRKSFFGNIINGLVFKILFPKMANWDLIRQDMQEDDANLKKILEGDL